MAAIISCYQQYSFSQLTKFQKYVSRNYTSKCTKLSSLANASSQQFKPSRSSEELISLDKQSDRFSSIKKSAISIALAIGLVTGFPNLGYVGQANAANNIGAAFPDLSFSKLESGLDELQKIVEDRNRDAVAPKQKELLNYVGGVEEDMVDGFPYEVPEDYKNMPLLKGRATVDMKVKVKVKDKTESE